jgi:hypothetical protein
MRTLLRRILPALVFTLTPLVFLPQSRAGNVGDDTNAASIPPTDSTTWAQAMHQIMGGTSNKPQPCIRFGGCASVISGPYGLYARVQLTTALANAHSAGAKNPKEVDTGLYNYFSYLLQNVAVSGIALEARWSDLSPMDPGDDFGNVEGAINSGALRFDYLKAALAALETWNSQPHFLQNPKTLQLLISPGFHSPDWLFQTMDSSGAGSCDRLFVAAVPPATTLSGCGYTGIFYDTEDALNDPSQAKQERFPLPWNSIYKTKWRNFLTFLNQYVGSSPEFVSIAVAGPTASSVEMILPNNSGKNAGPNALSLPGIAQGISVTTAWNCLLGNNYGVTGNCINTPTSYGTTPPSDYVNSDRAFIEEWAAAIDLFGQIFSDVTLVVTTGQGLPNFTVSGPTSPFLSPPPAFSQDCLISSNPSATPTMDCAAETAILAYFAEPSVGGANAKATAMNGLSKSPQALSTSSVKWLSSQTAGGPSVLNGSPALVSRMLGGAQFASQFSPTPNPITNKPPSIADQMAAEQVLVDVLKNFFSGTRGASTFGADAMGTNGTVSFLNAPINYLQVYDEDLIYAAGLQRCTSSLFQYPPPANGGLPSGCMRATIPSIPFMGTTADADHLFGLANYTILLNTAELVTLPPTCCPANYPYPRNAFYNDPVCVTSSELSQVTNDTNAAASSYIPGQNYTAVPAVPYGACPGTPYRQASMGDYVCVPQSHATNIATQNAQLSMRVQACPVVPTPILP